MEIIDRQFLETLWYGSRQMARIVDGRAINTVATTVSAECLPESSTRLMRLMRLVPINQMPNTRKKHPQHTIYPYLLRGLMIDQPNQVWCIDITYISMPRGFLYLVAIMNGYSRKILSWRLF